MAPLIGITTYAADSGGRVSLPRSYGDAVRRAGGHVVLLPPGAGEAAALVDRLDGVIVAGGGDLAPDRYGQPAHEAVYGTSPERDDAELALVDVVLERRVPTLAICRGMQVLNVARGGTLHQHLPDVVGEDVPHRLPPREPVPHDVSVEASSQLGLVMGAAEVTTMSWHHQGVDRLGDGLTVVASAPDGVVEGLAVEDHPWCLVVQWHPELTAATDPTQQALFDGLCRAADERSAA